MAIENERLDQLLGWSAARTGQPEGAWILGKIVETSLSVQFVTALL